MPDDRIDHDGLFKTLLTTFFFEFVELFLPELAAYVGRERVEFPDKTVLDFSYRVIQLNRLKWRDFIRQPNPVAAALMAKMQIPAEDRPRVKVEFMRMMATLRLDIGRSSQIRAFMETYLRLTSEEMVRYNREVEVIEPKERETIMEVVYEWDREAVERGKEQGLRQGSHQKGVQDILRLLSHRFGAVPQELQARIDGLADQALDNLLVDLLGFDSLTDAEAWIAMRG